MVNASLPIFDGHNDTLLKLEMAAREGSPLSFMEGDVASAHRFPESTGRWLRRWAVCHVCASATGNRQQAGFPVNGQAD